MNARVFGVSVQDLESHKGFASKNNLNFRLLVDDKRDTATNYGILTGPGGFAKRYTFYIDPLGVLRMVDDQIQVSAAGKEAIENLTGLQKSDLTLDQINTRIRALNAKVKAAPKDRDASTELATLVYLKGRTFMLSDKLPPRVRYPEALKQFRRALKLDPTLAAATEDKDQIEAIYKQMGRPVPE